MDQAPQEDGGVTQPQTPQAPSQNTLMGVLAYIGILVFIPFVVAKDDPFVKFHVKQGLVLFIIEAIIMVVSEMMLLGPLSPLLGLVNLGAIILSIIGIINVAKGEERELPLVGRYASNFKF